MKQFMNRKALILNYYLYNLEMCLIQLKKKKIHLENLRKKKTIISPQIQNINEVSYNQGKIKNS